MAPIIKMKTIINLNEEANWITIHLGKNPIKGGTPPNDRTIMRSSATTEKFSGRAEDKDFIGPSLFRWRVAIKGALIII